MTRPAGHRARHRAGALGSAAALAVLATGLGACADPVVEREAITSWDRRVATEAAFVADTYGHRWKHPVEVRFLDDATFERLAGVGGAAPAAAPPWQDTALGFATTSADEVLGPDAGTTLLGLYQPSSETLLVRGNRIDDTNAEVVVHELTHALQAQVAPAPDVTIDPDRALATRAVIEGDATSVAARWTAIHPAADPGPDDGDVDATPEDESVVGFGGTGALDWWRTLMPYAHGWRYVEMALAQGGTANRDRLLRAALAGRLTTFDILRLDVTTEGSDPPPLPAGAADDDAAWAASGPIGGARWYALLLGLDVDPQPAMATTWDDHSTRDGTCVEEALTGTRDLAGRYDNALRDWLARSGAARRDDGSGTSLILSWCDGAAPPAATTIGRLGADLQAQADAARQLAEAP